MSATPSHRSYRGIGTLALGGVALWVASRLSWVSAAVTDDKAGSSTRLIDGAQWAPVLAPAGLMIGAAAVALLLLRGWPARIVALLSGVVALAVTYPVVMLLAEGAAPQHAEEVLHLGPTTNLAAPHGISSWATVTETTVHVMGPLLAMVGVLLAVGGVAVVWRRPGAQQGADGYATAAQRRESFQDGAVAMGEKDLWDSLDAGVDPTDADPRV